MSVSMWFLKIYLVFFVVLQSHHAGSFDGFTRGETFYSQRKESEMLSGVSFECNKTIRSLDSNARWLCELFI